MCLDKKKNEATNPQVTHWCMTYFFDNQDKNYGQEAREDEANRLIEEIKNLGLIYAIFGWETCPRSGRLHLQISFITVERYRFEQIRKKFTPIHIEAMRKAAWRSKRYCSKEGKFIEIGSLPSGYEGEEPSANQVAKQVIELAKNNKIEEIMDRFPAVYMRQKRSIHEIAAEYEEWHPIGKKVCIWLYSKEYFRVGKSTFLAKHFPLSRINKVYWHPQFQSDFWERYNGETTVVFDDLGTRANWLADTLKRITSDTPCISNKKNSSCLTNIKNIFVSSNQLPPQLYRDDCGQAIAARFKIFQCVRHNDRDLLVTDFEKPNVLFPISLIAYLNNIGFNLIGNEEPSISDIKILGGTETN